MTIEQIGVFTPEQARELWQDYLTRKQSNPQLQKNYPQRRPPQEFIPRFKRAVAAEDVTAPASSLVAMTTFDFYFIRLQNDGTSAIDSDGPYTAYNNDPDFTCERGTLLWVTTLDGRWMPGYAACSPQSALITALDAL